MLVVTQRAASEIRRLLKESGRPSFVVRLESCGSSCEYAQGGNCREEAGLILEIIPRPLPDDEVIQLEGGVELCVPREVISFFAGKILDFGEGQDGAFQGFSLA